MPTDAECSGTMVMRYKERKVRLYFRGDAAFASRRYTNISKPGHPPQSERDSPAALFVEPFPRQLQLSGRIVEQEAPCRWPKWSGTPASWFLASVSSSLICRALPSWRSIITVARPIKEGKAINWTRLGVQQCRSGFGLQSGQLHEDTGAEGGGVARQAGEDRG